MIALYITVLILEFLFLCRMIWAFNKRNGIRDRAHQWNINQILSGNTQDLVDYDLGNLLVWTIKFWIWNPKQLTPEHMQRFV